MKMIMAKRTPNPDSFASAFVVFDLGRDGDFALGMALRGQLRTRIGYNGEIIRLNVIPELL